jgi:hypothetical protein
MALLVITGLLTHTPATAATATRAVTAASALPSGDGPPGFRWGTVWTSIFGVPGYRYLSDPG